jgi:pantoate--beta-alanine ligase
MEVHDELEPFRRARAALEGTVAFVPTMGFLHEGHLSLMRRAREEADHVTVSIYVNPTQFAPDEDLEDYPRDMEGDLEKCRREGVALVFTPDSEQIYPEGFATSVRVERLGDELCGRSRPHHFGGVTTIVAKLFHIVEPDVAVFGRKDYQQLTIVRRMARDLNFGVRVVGAPIVREPDGLAMSSRNRYLDAAQRSYASSLSTALVTAWRAYRREGLREPRELCRRARRMLAADHRDDVRVDYIQCVDPETLEALEGEAIDEERGAVLAMAVHVGPARLIDNVRLDRALPEALEVARRRLEEAEER